MVSWKIAGAICILSLLTLHLVMTFVGERFIQQDIWYYKQAPCVMPKPFRDALVNLLFTISDILTELKVSYTLCYGTLLGALRYGRILPWDNNVDLCVLRQEIAKVAELTLEEKCLSHNLTISYNKRHGEYIISSGPAKAILTVFSVSSIGEAYREGLENRLFYYFQRNQVTFPASLIDTPLHKLSLHNRLFPVPNKDDEILKYMYSQDWWTEQPPAGCKLELKLKEKYR